MGGTGSGSCVVVGFGISGVEPLCSAATTFIVKSINVEMFKSRKSFNCHDFYSKVRDMDAIFCNVATSRAVCVGCCFVTNRRDGTANLLYQYRQLECSPIKPELARDTGFTVCRRAYLNERLEKRATSRTNPPQKNTALFL